MKTFSCCLNLQVIVLPPFSLSIYFHLRMHWVKLMESYRAEDSAGRGGIKHLFKQANKPTNKLKFSAAVTQSYLNKGEQKPNLKTKPQNPQNKPKIKQKTLQKQLQGLQGGVKTWLNTVLRNSAHSYTEVDGSPCVHQEAQQPLHIILK